MKFQMKMAIFLAFMSLSSISVASHLDAFRCLLQSVVFLRVHLSCA